MRGNRGVGRLGKRVIELRIKSSLVVWMELGEEEEVDN